jgi:DNA-directed RNA polymerase specialized sigma24 family protein
VLSDVLPTVAISDPADLVISAERIRALQAHFDEVLSDLETEVLRLYVEGKSYQEIAERPAAPREVDRQRAAAHQAQARGPPAGPLRRRRRLSRNPPQNRTSPT